jgi:hypothetical protein
VAVDLDLLATPCCRDASDDALAEVGVVIRRANGAVLP